MISKWAVIQGGVVTNIVLWDGDTATWQPPADATMALFDPTIHVIQTSLTLLNQSTLQQKAQQALNTNATFQAIASPTNAQIAAQVQVLTKENNGIIRLLLGALDSTTGT